MRRVTNVVALLLGGLVSVATTDGASAQGSLFGWFDQGPPPSAQRQASRARVIQPYADRGLPQRRAVSAIVPRADLAPKVAALPTNVAGRPAVPLLAIVSLRHQHISIWSEGQLVLRSKVSTGTTGHRTPTGIFSVIQKNRIHHSNIYSNAPMPFMQRITWSGIALHAGVVPNYPASHGCIRLPREIAEQLFSMTRIGMRVIVADDDIVPVEIVSDLLPRAKLESAAMALALLNSETVTSGTMQTVANATARDVISASGSTVTAALVGALTDTTEVLDPYQIAMKRKAVTAAAVRPKAVAARTALADAAVKSAEANAALATLRQAKADLVIARAELNSIAVGADPASEDTAIARAAKMANVAAAVVIHQTAMDDEAVKTTAAFAAARSARQAEFAADDAPDQAKEAARGVEPVSVFISAKERRLFIRQGFEPVLDAEIAFRQPELPVGTHVFTAIAADATSRSRLHWSVVTLPSSSGTSAIDALNRVEMPASIRAEIEKRLWSGASLIISDMGLSNETGRGTDFVVLTK